MRWFERIRHRLCRQRMIQSSWTSYALNDLDLRMTPFIDTSPGFFIEAGANDGVAQSNTLFYERNFGWTGLLVESVPELARMCRANRPGCIVENVGLVARDYDQDTITMRYCGLMSVAQGAMSLEGEDLHIERGKRFLKSGEDEYYVEVPAETLGTLLEKHGIEKVKLLSLDVEGYEPQVLRGIDFDRTDIQYLLIEVRSQEEIESVIGQWYIQKAVLSFNPDHSDILYEKRCASTVV